MNGAQLLNLLKSILGGEGINQTYALQLINLARIRFEAMRPWKHLSTKDTSQTVTGANTYTTPFPLPANFQRYLGESELSEGAIKLFDGNNNIQYLTEVPIESILEYKNEFGRFAVDYFNQQFFITGIVPGSFNIQQYFIFDNDDITTATTWDHIPKRFHPILAFDAAARWRLGTDYDDVNARNADDNGKMVALILEAMSAWDTELAIGAVNSIEYRGDKYSNSNTNYPGPRGARANN